MNARNVQEMALTGDTIQGTFKQQVACPPAGQNAQRVDRFTRQRRSFADDDLFRHLQASGVTVNAKPPDQGAPL